MNTGTEVIQKTALTEMLISRQAQEVQAAIIIAKKFPRDTMQAYTRIMGTCGRISLAEQAQYTYPRGDKQVTGPSIRLAEAIAQNWGNIDFGIIELENKDGQSEMMAYAWDLETNTRVTKVFSVKHKRDTRTGSFALKDSRDIYELTANFGARRVRACILGVIPGDVVEAAVKQCIKTIENGDKTPIEDRIRTMLSKFQNELMVTQKHIEEYLGCKVKAFTENHLIKMRGVYQSITDGMSQKSDYFKFEEEPLKDAFSEKDKGNDHNPIVNQNDLNKAKDKFMSDQQKIDNVLQKEVVPVALTNVVIPSKTAFNVEEYFKELKAKHPHYDDSYLTYLTEEARKKW